MASPQAQVGPDTPIVIKITVNDASVRKLKLPLKDLGATVLPSKLRQALEIGPDEDVVFERFSDSLGGFITLNPANPAVFKTLIRAAKAKLKLRLKATVTPVAGTSPARDAFADIFNASAAPQQEMTTTSSMEPVILRSSLASRDSTALDRRSIGTGIFEFREARASQPAMPYLESHQTYGHWMPMAQAVPNMPPMPIRTKPLDQPLPSHPSPSDNQIKITPRMISIPSLNDNASISERKITPKMISVPNLHKAAASEIKITPKMISLRKEPSSNQMKLTPHMLPIQNEVPAPAVISNHGRPWSVYCDECDKPIADAHFHCSICSGGDFDLCESCVAGGKLCSGEGHWLIKRFIKDGKVITSTTERISPRSGRPAPVQKIESPRLVPGAFTVDESKVVSAPPNSASRTCNSCVVVLPEAAFVTCKDCDDFDLCTSCHEGNAHGHHPAHSFEPATENTVLSSLAQSTLAAGRNVPHNAICDGCDGHIYGVRHKCLDCPDFDYCSTCAKNAAITHPRHRFGAFYEPIANPQGVNIMRHHGIFCDGPLCAGKLDQSYIRGIRYKCAVCNDTDFCAACEALPGNHHNRTHPLIMFKTPVKNVNVSTENQDVTGKVRIMGDRPRSTASSIRSIPAPQPEMKTTQCQTVADIKPFVEEKKPIVNIPVVGPADKKAVPPAMLNAHFKTDSVADGTKLAAGARFTQIWTMYNPGPSVWPAGCSVRYVGGDNMLDVDNTHPISVNEISQATESNIVGREVQVGEQIAFKVTLKAPRRQGKAISYWRLKSPDGTPFGHRLWCDVDVQTIAPPSFPTPAKRDSLNDIAKLVEDRRMATEAAARQSAPPSYDNTMHHDLSARLAAMRLEQQRRREQAFTAQRDSIAKASKRDLRDEHTPSSMNLPVAGPSTTEDDRTRKEAAKARMEHIKAKILKTREERAKMIETKLAEERSKLDGAKQVAASKPANGEDKVQKIIQAVMGEGAVREDETVVMDESTSSSQMVFPKLDKESPASSTYQSVSSSKGKAAWVEDEDGEVEGIAAKSPQSTASQVEDDFEDVTDEIEVLSAGSEESEDDGFLTDEEDWDVLDASDAETVASP